MTKEDLPPYSGFTTDTTRLDGTVRLTVNIEKEVGNLPENGGLIELVQSCGT